MPRKRVLPAGMWSRGQVYYARFRANGRLVRKRLSTDFDAACTLLNELRARADRADFGLSDNDYPYEALKAEFLKWARQSVRRPHEYEADLKRIEAYATVRQIRQIDEQYALGYREWRLSQKVGGRPEGRDVSPRTVNREVGTLSNMLNRGVAWGRIGSNPIAGLKPLPNDSTAKQRRPLAIAEVQALFDNSPASMLPIWRMFMVTGLRREELVGLRFSDVDFQRQTVTVQASRSKNHKAREIPLDDAVLAMLAELRDTAKHRKPVEGSTAKMTSQQAARFSADHVFVTQANTPWRNNLLRRFYAICKRAGIDDAHDGGAVDIHSLRVTFTTLSLENGANPRAVQAILGHSTLALTMGVYAKATERSKRDAINMLPFASTSAPEHLITVQNAHSMSTAKKTKAQPKAGNAVA